MIEISKDGNMWCVLYGPDLQTGISGFGVTQADAFRAFAQRLEESGVTL